MDRVIAGVEKRMCNFSDDQQDQWRALFKFHQLYPTADSLPVLPINLSAPSGATYSMDAGSPVDWDASWHALAWRYDRPHRHSHQDADTDPGAASSTSAADAQAPIAPKAPVPVALINGVTGGNATKLQKKHASDGQTLLATVDALGQQQIESVNVGDLHWAIRNSPDGELFIQLLRITAVNSAGSISALAYTRKDNSFKWKETPVFTSKDSRECKISLPSLLPVPVAQTKAAAAAQKAVDEGSASQQTEQTDQATARVTKATMTLLRSYLLQHRPGLVRPALATAADS